MSVFRQNYQIMIFVALNIWQFVTLFLIGGKMIDSLIR
jgi:hypothetical protein